MLRLSLQDLVLRVKICNLGEVEETLLEAMDPPSSKNIRRAIESLKEVKALTSTEGLTTLGKQLAKLPLDVFLGKLIIYGAIFKCLDACVSIAAILSSKSPFVNTIGSNTQKDLARASFKRGDSDLLTVYNAYCAWRRIKNTPGVNEYSFCRKNFLSPQTLLNIEDIKSQLLVSIVDAGMLKLDADEQASLRR
jgi:ATP-dependent RNA helicase DHX29